MADDPAGGLLRPGEAATRLGLAANTLRLYSARFAPFLTPAAAAPTAGPGGRPGHRLYSPADLALLRRAHELVATGLTYEQAAARLRADLAPRAPAEPPRPAAPARAEPAAPLTALQQAVEAWRALAEERAREAGELRSRLAAAQAELAEERRRRLAAEEVARLAVAETRGEPGRGQSASWLARLLAGEPEGRAGRPQP